MYACMHYMHVNVLCTCVHMHVYTHTHFMVHVHMCTHACILHWFLLIIVTKYLTSEGKLKTILAQSLSGNLVYHGRKVWQQEPISP